jgi:putative tricarboxylic transport membrane protein
VSTDPTKPAETGASEKTEANSTPPSAGWRPWLREHSELGVSALLLLVGLLVLGDTLTMETVAEQRGPVGPRTVPLVVGGALLVVAVVLAVDVLRGGRGAASADGPAAGTGADDEAAAGPGADDEAAAGQGDEPADWRTVALLAGIFLASAALIDPLGFPVTGALLFWGSAYALGSRNLTRDPLIAAVLSVATFAVFNTLLGVPLPGGPLMGVL